MLRKFFFRQLASSQRKASDIKNILAIMLVSMFAPLVHVECALTSTWEPWEPY